MKSASRWLQRAAASAGVALAAACGGGGTEPPAPPPPPPTVATVVTVSSARTTLFKAGDTLTFTAAATDSNANPIPGQTFTWSSTLTGVATVNATTGKATAGVTNGTTAIQATTGTVTGSKNLTVNRLVASVTVQSPGARTNDTLTTFTGTLVYTGTAFDSGGTAIAPTSFTWTTSNSRIASISPASGTTTTATVAGEGTATITGTASGKAAQTTLVMQLPPVSFATDVQSIFTTSCAKSLCHDAATAEGGLNLTASAYSRIVNQPPSASQPYIKPNDPANSMIILRTEGTISPRMPEDGPPFLTSAQMALIRTWITRGAPNN
ncbi:MAG: Ig-like domain-containing protein [Gemmatimonadales bacterium]|nr:Ig-like domain-containing protein [Gemmatimonadales bacterium]